MVPEPFIVAVVADDEGLAIKILALVELHELNVCPGFAMAEMANVEPALYHAGLLAGGVVDPVPEGFTTSVTEN